MSQRDSRAYFNFEMPMGHEPGPAFTLHPRKAGGAVASLVLGILAVPLVFYFIGFPLAIAGIVCGIVGLVGVKKGGGRITGKAMSIAGLALSVIALATGIFVAPRFATKDDGPYVPPPIPAHPVQKPVPKALLENP